MKGAFILVADHYINDDSLADFSLYQVSGEFRNVMMRRYSPRAADVFLHCFPTAEADWKEIWNGKRSPILQSRRLAQAVKEERVQQRQEEERREYQQPANILSRAYIDYVTVRKCSEARQGYQAVYVNEVDLSRARFAASQIEQRSMKQDSTIDKDRIWNAALQNSVTIPSEWGSFYATVCRGALQDLLAAAPPETPMKKDF